MAIGMIAAPPPDANDSRLPPIFFNVFRIVLPLFYALPAIWGIVSGIGLLQLKNWARISTIIFSVLLIVFGVFGMLSSMIFFLKPPPSLPFWRWRKSESASRGSFFSIAPE